MEEARILQEDQDAIRQAVNARKLHEDSAIRELDHFKQQKDLEF